VKKLLNSNFFQRVIVFVFLFFYRILAFTWRKKVIYHPTTQKLVDTKAPFAIACWHQNNLTNMWLNKVVNALIMASPSLEGRLIGLAIEKIGGTIAWGSSRKQPIAALKSIVRLTRETGKCPVITVDGPIGPRHVPKPGILEVARLAKLPVVPLGTQGHNSWVLKKTWDLTEIPKPFSKVIFYFGEPMDPEKLSLKSEESILTLAKGIDDAQRKSTESN
jgi:lysophospholipid acyltransferase (LPLAT)-like uncharacterized protein